MNCFTVILTQDTLEDVKEKLTNCLQKLTPTITHLLAKKEAFLANFVANSPYADHNWRKRGPDRITVVDWLGNDEISMKKCTFLRELKQDLNCMARTLKTTEYDDAIDELNRYFETSKFADEELTMCEAMQYGKSKSDWEMKDASWIISRKLESEHSSHKTKEEWEELFKKDPAARKWYDNVIPNSDECMLCIKRKEFVRKQDEFEKKENQRLVECEVVVPREIKTFECEDCKFKCTNQHVYNSHVQSMEHKTVMRFCNECKLQCRNDGDYEVHLTSRKHKIATGEEKEYEEYHCEPCKYTTAIKCNYSTHCKSKGHIEKTKD